MNIRKAMVEIVVGGDQEDGNEVSVDILNVDGPVCEHIAGDFAELGGKTESKRKPEYARNSSSTRVSVR